MTGATLSNTRGGAPMVSSLYGYKRTFKNLNYVVVRNGGHELPLDQPEAMLELITAFIEDTEPFTDEPTTTVE
ncbi:hypothetical protein MRX96_036263 [Rhipicephalus microplus]